MTNIHLYQSVDHKNEFKKHYIKAVCCVCVCVYVFELRTTKQKPSSSLYLLQAHSPAKAVRPVWGSLRVAQLVLQQVVPTK